jgi:exonuclease SbcC
MDAEKSDAAEAIKRELALIAEKDAELSRREDGFAQELARLNRARAATEFSNAYAVLIALRREQENDKRRLAEYQTRTPEAEAEVRVAEDDMQSAANVYSQKLAELKTTQEVVGKVRELDVNVIKKDGPIIEARAEITRLTAASSALAAEIEADALERERTNIELRDARQYVQHNSIDERLPERVPSIRARFEALTDALERRERVIAERSSAERGQHDAQAELDDRSAVHETLKARHSSLESALRNMKASRDELLGGATLDDHRETLAALLNERAWLLDVEKIIEDREEPAEALRRAKERTSILEVARRDKAREMARVEAALRAAEKERSRCETHMALIRRIAELEADRAALSAGDPCPLCGSTAHPFAMGRLPDVREAKAALDAANSEADALSASFAEVSEKEAQIGREMAALDDETARLRERVGQFDARLSKCVADLGMSSEGGVFRLDTVRARRQRADDALQKEKILVGRAEQLGRDIEVARAEIESVRSERDEAARARQETEFRLTSASLDLRRASQELHVQDEDIKNIQIDLIRQVSPWGFRDLPVEHPETVMAALEDRLARWLEYGGRLADLEKRSAIMDSRDRAKREELNAKNAALKKKTDLLRRLNAEKEAFRQQRVALMEDRSPDAEEDAAVKSVEFARTLADVKREERSAVVSRFADMRHEMEDLARSVYIRSDAILKASASFEKLLASRGFKNEDDYLASCLPESERKTLQERARTLAAERAELDARRSDAIFRMAELRRSIME